MGIGLFEKERELVVFISGLEFMNIKEKMSTEVLLKLLIGSHGSKEER